MTPSQPQDAQKKKKRGLRTPVDLSQSCFEFWTFSSCRKNHSVCFEKIHQVSMFTSNLIWCVSWCSGRDRYFGRQVLCCVVYDLKNCRCGKKKPRYRKYIVSTAFQYSSLRTPFRCVVSRTTRQVVVYVRHRRRFCVYLFPIGLGSRMSARVYNMPSSFRLVQTV